MKEKIRQYFIANTVVYDQEQFNIYWEYAELHEPKFNAYCEAAWVRYFENDNCLIFQNSFFNLVFREAFPHLAVSFIKRDQVRDFLK